MNPGGTSRFLLDTCTLIDLTGEPGRVSESVRALFGETSTRGGLRLATRDRAILDSGLVPILDTQA